MYVFPASFATPSGGFSISPEDQPTDRRVGQPEPQNFGIYPIFLLYTGICIIMIGCLPEIFYYGQSFQDSAENGRLL